MRAAVSPGGPGQRPRETRKRGTGMQRVAFILRVKPERLEEYKRRHREVWPEMLQALRETGWHNYSLFMRKDGLIFGYFETDTDLATAQAKMGAKEVNT